MKKSTAQNKSLDKILRTYLKQQSDKRLKEIDNDWWWASELGQCQRKAFLRRLGIPPKPKKWRISFVAEEGKAIHEWIENMVAESGHLVAKEFSLIDEGLKYKGRGDLMVNLASEKRPYLSLIDIKTQRPEAFFRRKRLPKGQKVKSFQKLQLSSYVYFIKKQWSQLVKDKVIDKKYKPSDLKDARIYYIDRGGGVREEFIFHFKQKDFDKVLTELNILNKYWKEKKLPPCKNLWTCSDMCKFYERELNEIEKGELTLEDFVKKHTKAEKK